MLSKPNTIRRALNLLAGSSGRETALSIIILTVRAFLPLIAVLLLGRFVDLLTGDGAAKVTAETGASLTALTWLTVAIATALLLDDLLSYAGQYINRKHSYLLEGHISSLIHAHTRRLGLKFFEDPRFHDRLERAARDISWRPAALVSDFILMLRGVISLVAMAYVLRSFGFLPLLILITVFIPVLLVRVRNSRRLYETRKKVTTDSRQASYFSWLLTGEKPAREVKLFDLGGYFDRLFRKHFRASREPELDTVRRNMIPESLASVLKVAAFAGVLVYATSRYLSSSITAGELAMYLVAFRQALVYLRDAVSGYSGLAENGIFLQDLFLFLDLEPDMEGKSMATGPESVPANPVQLTGPESVQANPAQLAGPESVLANPVQLTGLDSVQANPVQLDCPDMFSEIRVENLTFSYPGASRPALQEISLRIGRGEKVAIVGPNGSGKTTLVKLLCRLYDPDQGCITVDDRDITAFDPASYRELFSVVFQNFMLYYLSAGDNIRLGHHDDNCHEESAAGANDSGKAGKKGGTSRNAGSGEAGSHEANDSTSGTDKMRKAAEIAGVRELLESLPEGYDTPLGHHTEGGRELSWGEWQKIALARAVYRKSPVLILDEPASSLDADSEYEIFSDLTRITGGRTCIFISHRLSNVRDADRIIVLDRGRIAETGTHDELIAAGGRYHTMFTRQKSMYR